MRSDVFEEDPCPGTGKYIEAHYQCLGWFTFFYSDVVFARSRIYAVNLEGFAFRSRTAKEPHNLGNCNLGSKEDLFRPVISSYELIVDVRSSTIRPTIMQL